MVNVSGVGILVSRYRLTVTHVPVPVMVDHNSVMVVYHMVRHCFNDKLGSDFSVLFADDMGASYTVNTVFCDWGRLRENCRMVVDMWRRVLCRLICLWVVKLIPLNDWLVMESIIVMLFVGVPDSFAVNMIWTTDLVVN